MTKDPIIVFINEEASMPKHNATSIVRCVDAIYQEMKEKDVKALCERAVEILV